MKKVYLAATFGAEGTELRTNAEAAAAILERKGMKVYRPWTQKIPHAWDYPNHEWGQMVFTNDVMAIQDADIVVGLSYGREQTCGGTNWELGYAFGIGKDVVLVEMNDEIQSLMVANGRYATVEGLDGLLRYDFDEMPIQRTRTEQK